MHRYTMPGHEIRGMRARPQCRVWMRDSWCFAEQPATVGRMQREYGNEKVESNQARARRRTRHPLLPQAKIIHCVVVLVIEAYDNAGAHSQPLDALGRRVVSLAAASVKPCVGTVEPPKPRALRPSSIAISISSVVSSVSSEPAFLTKTMEPENQ